MGGGPDKEHLVIILWDPEPKEITDGIRKRFPYMKVTYFCLKDASKPVAEESDRVDKGSKRDRFVFQHLLSHNSYGLAGTY